MNQVKTNDERIANQKRHGRKKLYILQKTLVEWKKKKTLALNRFLKWSIKYKTNEEISNKFIYIVLLIQKKKKIK